MTPATASPHMPHETPNRPSAVRPSLPPRHAIAILALWLAIFFASLFSPPLLDDADATHSQAARAILVTGDWVTLHVNGIRYLEKAPLPYWLVATSFRVFGHNTFAAHLPFALCVLALALLGYRWSRRAFNDRAALYTALAMLTCVGTFLFTRVFIPEALLSLLLAISLYALFRIFDVAPTERLHAAKREATNLHPYILWAALALAVLTKGLVALVFFFVAAFLFLALTGELSYLRKLRPVPGILLFLLLAAPWHVLAALRNPATPTHHGFLWFYFINEHVLRFLGRRIPRDYNKLPGYLYWTLHLVWLFPWSLFVPAGLIAAWRGERPHESQPAARLQEWPQRFRRRCASLRQTAVLAPEQTSSGPRTILLLSIVSTVILVFFSLSTNQEYYTFPAYLPLLLLIVAGLVFAERRFNTDQTLRRSLLASHAVFTAIGLASAAALAYGLYTARTYPYVADIGDLLAHRNVGNYTLSMSHFFDLTGPSFAALRLPASLALTALAIGPALAWILRARRHHLTATSSVVLTTAVFLVAAHIALTRFGPMLSSKDFAERIEELADDNRISRDNDVLLFGDQAYGSSIPFYLNEEVDLVDGRTTSMEFGSTFPDAPPIFLTSANLVAGWGHGRRKVLFVPLEKRDEVDRLLGDRQILLEETSGKALITDRPLNTP